LTGLLYIIAEARGDAPKQDTPLHKLFKYHWDKSDPRKRNMTVRHLMEMTDGFATPMTTSIVDGELCRSDEPWVKMLDEKLAHAPGEKWRYHFQLPSDLLAFVLQDAVGMPLQDYANKHLFHPMGLKEIVWPKPFKKYSLGCDGILMSIREMMLIGTLIGTDGMWQGKQIGNREALRKWRERVADTNTFVHLWKNERGGGGVRATGIWGQVILMCPNGWVASCQSEDDGHHGDQGAQTKAEKANQAIAKVLDLARPPPPVNHPNVIKIIDDKVQKDGKVLFMCLMRGHLVVDRATGVERDVREKTEFIGMFFTSLAYIIAQSRGEAPGLDTPLTEIFKDYDWEKVGPRKKKITVRHLLEHKTGLEAGPTGFVHMMPGSNAKDPLQYFLNVKMNGEPGSKHELNSVASDLLALVVQKSTQMKLIDYLDKQVFCHLGIRNVKIRSFKTGEHMGSYSAVEISMRELLTVGHFLEQEGKWNGKQIVEKQAIKNWVKMVREKPYAGIRNIWGGMIVATSTSFYIGWKKDWVIVCKGNHAWGQGVADVLDVLDGLR